MLNKLGVLRQAYKLIEAQTYRGPLGGWANWRRREPNVEVSYLHIPLARGKERTVLRIIYSIWIGKRPVQTMFDRDTEFAPKTSRAFIGHMMDPQNTKRVELSLKEFRLLERIFETVYKKVPHAPPTRRRG
jgi:hypothetical protein